MVSFGVISAGIVFFFCGCKPKTAAEQLEKVRYTLDVSENPCVYICGIPKTVGELAPGHPGEMYSCQSLSNFDVATGTYRNPVTATLTTLKARPFVITLCLYKREKDPSKPGNLLMDWEIEYQGTVYPVKNVSWNQKDLLLLWTCNDGAVYLDREKKSSIK